MSEASTMTHLDDGCGPGIPNPPDTGKAECRIDPRDAEIAELRAWTVDLRSAISGLSRELDRLAGRHHDALVARDHYKRLSAAACEFLRSPALHTLRVGDRRFSREELID